MTTYTFDEDLISDLHKDAYGFRPSQSFWAIFACSNGDQKQAIWDDLLETLEATVARERQEHAIAAERFEHLIADLIRCGAQDFTMAIKWLHEAHDTNGEDDYLEYMLNLSYGYIRKARCAADVVTV